MLNTSKEACSGEFFSFDWSEYSSPLTGSTWAIVSGDVTISDDTFNGQIATIKVSAGTAGTVAVIENNITTATENDCKKLRITII